MGHVATLLRTTASTVLLLGLAACASNQHWTPAGGDREQGVVRLSYEYPEYRQPQVSDTQAQTLALNRCHAWGYEAAEPIAGAIRQCANVDDGNCNLWTVTREFQCKGDSGQYVSRLSR